MAISRRRVLTGGAAVGAASIFAPGLLGSPARAATGLAVTWGKVDITPSEGYVLAGYGVLSRIETARTARGVQRPLYARCTIIWDNGWPNVIVTVDTLCIPRSLNQAIRGDLAALGVASSDFILTATHTHTGGAVVDKLDPYMAYNTDSHQNFAIQTYTGLLRSLIRQLVADTLRGFRFACTLDYKVLDEDFSRNRAGMSYVERDVPTLVARDLGGDPLVVLFGFGCHPVTMGQTIQEFHPDYPGPAIERIETTTGAFAQFILGPAGDQNPTVDPIGGLGLDLTKYWGSDLGQVVVNGIGTPGRPLTGPISTGYRDLNLPLDITDNPNNLNTVKVLLFNRILNAGTNGYTQRHALAMIAQINAHSFATSVPVPLQVWKFPGSPTLRLAFTGGELVSGYAAFFRPYYGGSNGIWIAGYANEIPAYIPTDELLRRTGGSYEGGFDSDYPGIGGGSMCVYGYLGHFKGRPAGTTEIGVEQMVISSLSLMLL